jgi:hypothetical protein
MNALETINIESLITPSNELRQKVVRGLESGKVVYFPKLSFDLLPTETRLLTPAILKPKSKNVSFDSKTDKIQGVIIKDQEAEQLKSMIKRFANFSHDLLQTLIPGYFPNAIQARTSYRPAETAGRKLSHLKDDSLLHVDSFPANPVKGHRILRIFTNINPEGKPRVWKVGEPFSNVINKMAPRLKKPIPGMASLMNLIGITKGYRTLYDHYMLQIHDAMKNDSNYQKTVSQQEIRFPPGTSWMVFTDQVSHAVLAGQYVLEQTFYLPPKTMHYEQHSPLRMLEKKLNQKLV